MEKIRSGQSFLYRMNGLSCTVMDIRLKKKVRGAILHQALLNAIKRYPYFASKLVEKHGDFYIFDNRDISLCAKRKRTFHPLGSMSNGYHLIEVTYYKENIRVAFHHALCDGIGIKPFIETLLYYYFCILDNREYSAPNVRKMDDPLFDDETTEPFDKKREHDIYNQPIIIKDGFSLPEYAHQIEDNDYRFEIEVDADDYMHLVKSFHATPAILLSYLIFKSILIHNPTIDKPIVCSMATNMRKELGLPHTHKNCVRSMYLSFDQNDDEKDINELCASYRKTLYEQRKIDYVKEQANSFLCLNERLDQLSSLEEKKEVMAFFDDMTVNSFVISYLGTFDLGECNKFIDAIHFYSGGIKGITVNMTATNKKFNITFIQNIETDQYVKTLLTLLKKHHINYDVNEKVYYSTTKDKVQKTAKHHAERSKINSFQKQ